MTEPEQIYDLCIIGGGINGAGIARDAAGRGLSVILIEAGDLGGATSSASTKLIHGGLRYLEYYEFKLVREALKEREVLRALAPHIIWPLEFILPHDKNVRPAWMIRAGLFLYDHLGGRKSLPGSKSMNFGACPPGTFPLQERYKRGFRYTDCWVEDSRLVILNAVDARNHGATILPRTKCTGIKPDGDQWHITLENRNIKNEQTVRARMVVNAAGPWVKNVLDDNGLTQPDTPHVRLVKGSHIIVPRMFEGERAYILQQPDGRIVFAIPYEHDYTLIGTTEVDFNGDPHKAAIEDKEIEYLRAAVNRSFKKQTGHDDIVHTYSGVRPLFDDGHSDAKSVTRDYRLDLDNHNGLPLLSVFGGKITTYRKLAEDAVNHLLDFDDDPRYPWTADRALPGGNFRDFDKFLKEQKEKYPDLPDALLHRYARAYGTLMEKFLTTTPHPLPAPGKALSRQPSASLSPGGRGIKGEGASPQLEKTLGKHYGDNVYEAEIKYLIAHEWAQTLDDILWRRSKLGLHISEETKQNLENFLKTTNSHE